LSSPDIHTIYGELIMGMKDWIKDANAQALRETMAKSMEEIEGDETLRKLSPSYEIRHRIPGRIRLTFPLFRSNKNLRTCMKLQLASGSGITRVTTSALSTSITVYYNPEEMSEESLFDIISKISIGDLLQWKDQLPPSVPTEELFGNLNLWVIGGSIFLVLGIAGLALPVLPGTPLLILSAACYLRGSKKLYNWLVNHEILGRYVKAYYEGRGVPLRAKLYTIGFLWLSTTISLIVFRENIYYVVFLLLMSSGVTIYMLSLKTLDPTEQPDSQKESEPAHPE